MPAERRTLATSGLGSSDWWTSQLDWATETRKELLTDRQYHIRAYRDKLVAVKDQTSAIRVNIEYEKTEQKRHQLFFRVPKLTLKPHPRTARGQEQQTLRRAVAIFQEVLQRLAGPKGLKTKKLIDKLLFDVLCPAGIAACKIGYEQFEQGTIPVQVGTREVPTPGSILGLGPTTLEPIVQQVPNVIKKRYIASRISPSKLLVPPDFDDNDYSGEADWLGWDFPIERHEALRRDWAIPRDFRSSDESDDDRLVPLDRQGTRKDQLKCREIFYYASRIDQDVTHPEKIRRLVFVKGVDQPVVSQDLADQVFNARGELTSGLRTLPIKVLTLRYVSDYPFPPSDCAVSRRQADELSEGRTQMVVHRKKAIPMRQIDIDRIVDERVRTLIKRGEYLDLIPASGPTPIVQEIASARWPRENFGFNDYIMADVDRLWALGANQQGIRQKSVRTATELALIQQATDTRLSAEQEDVTALWVTIMEAIGQLVQLHADEEDYIEIVGEDGARQIEAWDKRTISGEFLYSVVPDSAARPDAAHDRDLALNRYNLLINSPFINGEQLTRETVEVFGGDPDRLVKAPPPPPPEKPRISVSVKGDDLDPRVPQYGNMTRLLQAAGIPAQLDPASPAAGGTPQDGGEPVGPAEVVDRERLRMAEADEGDQRAGGLTQVTQ